MAVSPEEVKPASDVGDMLAVTFVRHQSESAVMANRASILVAAMLVLAGCHKQTPPQEGKSVSELQSMLASTNSTTQAQGAIGLSKYGAAALPALPALTGLLSSPRPLVRQQAALAIGQIGPSAVDAVPALTASLDDSEWLVRRQAAIALGSIGPPARPALSALERLEQDSSKVVSQAAREAKSRINGAGG
jgi:HEAT repeat protein